MKCLISAKFQAKKPKNKMKFAVFIIFSCFTISFIGARTQFHSWGNVNATELGRTRVLLSRPVNNKQNFYFTYPDVRRRFRLHFFLLKMYLSCHSFFTNYSKSISIYSSRMSIQLSEVTSSTPIHQQMCNSLTDTSVISK